MGYPVQQTDHESVALALLPQQFSEASNLRAILSAIVGPSASPTNGIQDIENVAFQLLEDRWLDTATGAQLDALGKILGLPRISSSDTEYRYALYIQVAINTSQGDPERLIYVAKQSTSSTAVSYMQKNPARAKITCIGATTTTEIDRLHKVVPAGVALDVQATSNSKPFIYGKARDALGAETTITPTHPYGGGFSLPGSGVTGGVYAALYYHTS